MIIGVPKEIKNNESRIALTPGGTLELVKRGHTGLWYCRNDYEGRRAY